MEKAPMTSQTFPIMGRNPVGWTLFWLLTAMLILGLIHGMNDAIRGLSFWGMTVLGSLAIIAGWILGGFLRGKTPFYILGLFAGLALIIVVNSGSYRNLLRLLFEEIKLIRPGFSYNPQYTDLTPIIIFGLRFYNNLFSFFMDIHTWITQLLNDSSGFSPTITRTIWEILVYTSIYTTGWLIRLRIHTIIAALPIMVLLIGITTYTRQNSTGLVLTLLSMLLLTVLVEHLRHEQNWKKHNVDYSEELPYDIAFFGIPLILAIIFLAGSIPNIPYEAIIDYYDQIRLSQSQKMELVDEALGLEVTPRVQSSNKISGGLPQGYLIGAGPELSDKIVMEIDIGGIFFQSDETIDVSIPKYYWFGRSYDIYTGNGWITSEIDYKSLSKNEIIITPNMDNSRVVNQKIYKTKIASTTLYFTGIPYIVDKQVTTAWRKTTGEYFSAELQDETYQVSSYLLNVSEDQLQESSEALPEKILETYLQIPEEMPARVRKLALSITQRETNPYDKAKAIETYLRQFDYTLDLPKPPEDRDIVDYFLFDLKKGYCDYFSSAMVMIARSVGLPGRLVVGYSSGQYNYGRNVFVVTEANAHAWPEIYISPFGWVPFEPTTSMETLIWKHQPQLTEEDEYEAIDQSVEVSTYPNWVPMLLFFCVSTAVIFLGYLLYKNVRGKNQRSSTSQQIEKIYFRMKKHLNQSFIPLQSSKTPIEIQNDLITYFVSQKSSRANTFLIKEICRNICRITKSYQQGIYTIRPLSIKQVKNAKQDLTFLLFYAFALHFSFIFKK